MAFTVRLADGAINSYPDQGAYEFLPNGVLACTNDELNATSYYSPGYWQVVHTENGHKPDRKGYPLPIKLPGTR